MKLIRLHNGDYTQVDDEDYDMLMQFTWHMCNGYAARKLRCGKTILMHNEIMPASDGAVIDHKDRVKLNNKKSNFRIVTQSENMQNAVHPHNTSGYRGVAFNKTNNAWQAQIMKNYKLHYLGRFETKEDAAFAYDVKAIELHGDDAYINIPENRAAIIRFINENRAVANLV